MRFVVPLFGQSGYGRYTSADEADLIRHRRWAMWSRLGLWVVAVVLAAAPMALGSGSTELAFAFALCAICIIDALEVLLSKNQDDWRSLLIFVIFALVLGEVIAITRWSGQPLQPLSIVGLSFSGRTVVVGLTLLAFGQALTARILHAVR